MGLEARYESADVDPTPLGRPLKFEFSGRTAPTRFLKAAMTERQSSWDPENLEVRGVPSQELINVYKRWGEGGFGVILTGNLMIDYDQLEAAGNAIIPPDAAFSGERFDAFRDLATQSKKHGALIIGQVSHPGRQVIEMIQKDPVSASNVQLKGAMGMTFAQPHPASQEEIDQIVKNFAHAAEFLEKAGYDGIQLHGAHGYLLAQFLSLTTNQRTDKYGGSLENRARLIIEIADAIRKRVQPSFILSIKLNSVEFQDKGFQPEEAKSLCAMLEEHHFDFVELSGGTYEHFSFYHKRESTKKREAFFIEFAETITPSLNKTKSYITGGLRTAGAMVKALDVVDGVGLGRPICQEFHLPKDILEGKTLAAGKLKLDENDFGSTNAAAGTQMKQVGKDQDPIDLTNEKNKDAFLKELKAWRTKVSEDPKRSLYGFPTLTSVEAVPYGSTGY